MESYYFSMITQIGGRRRPPKLYIEEWMKTVPGLDRKRLAERMGVSPGTITKKLSDPSKIDALWMVLFAEGLGLEDVTDLFRDPNAPTRDDLLRGLDDKQRQDVVDYVDFVRQRTGTDG